MPRLLALARVLFALSSVAAIAQPVSQSPRLVQDFVGAARQSSTPSSMIVLNSKVVFTADTPGTGRELFRSDGTEAGTFLVEDIRPGDSWSIGSLVPVGTTDAFFVADDGVHGSELWHTDGTAAGTFMVKDICPGTCTSSPAEIYAYPPYGIYFSATDGVAGKEIWYADIDGDPSSAVRVEDINPGSAGSSPSDFQLVQGRLFFAADDGVHGRELWVREATTHLVEDINPGAAGSNPSSFVDLNDSLFFIANDGTTGIEVWSSSYTAGSAFRVADIRSGAAGSIVDDNSELLLVSNGYVYFIADDGTSGKEVWRANSVGASLVQDVCSGSCQGAYGVLTSLATATPTVLFAGFQNATGIELWKTQGTSGTTAIVQDLRPGGNSGFFNLIGSVAGTTAYVRGDNGTDGMSLYKTTGSTLTLVSDVFPNSTAGDVGLGVALGSNLYFGGEGSAEGIELWKTDGLSSGTTLVENLAPDEGGSYPQGIGGVLGTAILSIDTPASGREPGRTNGSTGSMTVAADIRPGIQDSIPISFVFVNGMYFFSADDGANGRELWKTSHLGGVATLVKDIRPGTASSSPQQFHAVGSLLLFTADDGVNGRELWKSDGTTAGTVLVKDIRPGSTGSTPLIFLDTGGLTYFSADDGVSGRELWKTNGSEGGTTLVMDILPGSTGSFPDLLDIVGSTIFFRANDGAVGDELWKISGGVVSLVRDIQTGAEGSEPFDAEAVGSLLFFFANDGVNGNELWRSDGTFAGTNLVFNGAAGAAGCEAFGELTSFAGRVWYPARCGSSGAELYNAQDVGVGGLVKDICAGACSSGPTDLRVIGDRLYFSAFTEANGRELWSSLGTTVTTLLLQDIEPGPISSDPKSMHVSGNLLYFSAHTTATSREPWVHCGAKATQYDIYTGSTSASPGQAFSITLQPRDASDLYVPCYGGRVQFTSSDGAAVLPADEDVSPGDLEHSVVVTLNSPGPQTITLTDSVDPTVTATVAMTVLKPTWTALSITPASPSHPNETYTFTAQVTSAYPGTQTGTVVFYSDDLQIGTGTLNGSAVATLVLTFVPPGSHSFQARYAGDATFLASNSAYVNHFVYPAPPSNLVATATSATTVSLEWSTAMGAVQYAIYRSTSGTSFQLAATINSFVPQWVDEGRAADTSYLYHVKSIDNQGNFSVASNSDVATTVMFTDAPLTTATAIKSLHITQLRTAATALNTLSNGLPFAFQSPAAVGDVVRKGAIDELRVVISNARFTLGLPAVSFTDPSLTAGVTRVKRVHVEELRDGTR